MIPRIIWILIVFCTPIVLFGNSVSSHALNKNAWNTISQGDKKKQLDSLGTLIVKKSRDFTITGRGSADNWTLTEWVNIPQRKPGMNNYITKAKVLYSETGIYFLFDCEDRKLTASMNADFMDLWKEDVVEVFLMPEENSPVYFEYEISPLNYELPILISNNNGDLARWMPFHYDADRKTIHATSVQGGARKSNSAIKGWTAEFFIPFKLLRPMNNIYPQSGTQWKANLCRIDYDEKEMVTSSWQLTQKNFHDYKSFGTLIFE